MARTIKQKGSLEVIVVKRRKRKVHASCSPEGVEGFNFMGR